MTKRLSAAAFGLKLLVTAGLLYFLLRKVDLAPTLGRLRSIEPGVALAVELVFLVQQAMLAVRWQLVARIVGSPLSAGQAFRLTLIGHFFNQVLPSGLAGDAARAWMASREGAPVGPTVRAILCDRLIGLMALVLIIAATPLLLPELAAESLPGAGLFRLVSLATLGGLALFLAAGEPVAACAMRFRATRALGGLMRDLLHAFRSGLASLWILALALAVQMLNVTVVALCAKAMNIQLELGVAWVVIPTVMLVSMAPVSFAGWGVREGAMVFGLGLLGFAPEAALAVSVAFGALQTLLGAPGGVLWLARGGRGQADRPRQEVGGDGSPDSLPARGPQGDGG
jgi:glycosyltransferase 2 family protein